MNNLILTIWIFVLAVLLLSKTTAHSGLYLVNNSAKANDFSAAWLISRTRLLQAENSVAKARGMSEVTLNILQNNYCDNCFTLMARDWLDFMVEHLSSSTNQIPNLPFEMDTELYSLAIHKVQYTSQQLKKMVIRHEKDARLDRTLGVLVYSPVSYSKPTFPLQRKIRPVFFEATFWSLHRYVRNIAIFVATAKDAQDVKAMRLPHASLEVLKTELDIKNRTRWLPRDAVAHVITQLKTRKEPYSKFQYVFFSEGDQILHLRDASVLYDAIDASNGTFIVVPQRLQTITLKQDHPVYLQHKWPALHAQDVPGVRIVLENLSRPSGSCCHNGDIEVARCPGWWYQCPSFGLKNLTTWLKFGDSGFTMPPATEHRSTCQYSAEAKVCALPAHCAKMFPEPVSHQLYATKDSLCTEVRNVRYFGYNETQLQTLFGVTAEQNTAAVDLSNRASSHSATSRLSVDTTTTSHLQAEQIESEARNKQEQVISDDFLLKRNSSNTVSSFPFKKETRKRSNKSQQHSELQFLVLSEE